MRNLIKVLITTVIVTGAVTYALMDAAANAAQDKANVAASVVQPPKESRLAWENHQLRAANLRLQAEAEDRAAAAEYEAMQKAVGDKYEGRISRQTGILEFYLKEVQAIDTKAKSSEKLEGKPK